MIKIILRPPAIPSYRAPATRNTISIPNRSVRRAFALVALLALTATLEARAVPAKKKPLLEGTGLVILTNSDREISGVFLRETEDTIWLGRDRGEIGVEKTSIRSLRREETPDSEFVRRQRALVPTEDPEAHWALAQWADENGLDESANTEARTAVRIKRSHHAARDFLARKGITNAYDMIDDSREQTALAESRRLAAKPRAPVKKKNLVRGTGVIVHSSNGREISGAYLKEEDGTVWVSVDQGEIGVQRSAIVKISIQETPDSEFIARKAQLAPHDVVGRYELIQWAERMGLTQSAILEAKDTLVDNPRANTAHNFLDGKDLLDDGTPKKNERVNAYAPEENLPARNRR